MRCNDSTNEDYKILVKIEMMKKIDTKRGNRFNSNTKDES